MKTTTWIQDRDRSMMEKIQDHRFLLSEQIYQYIFKGTNERTARARLEKLETAGLIRREFSIVFRSQRIIRLTQRGEALVNAQRSPGLRITKRFDTRTLEHDSIVSSVRFRVEEHWQGVWIPEAALKAEAFPQIPDGVFVFPNETQVAIEVENSPKGPARFHQIQERWRSVPVALILYVATSPEMMASVRSYLKSGPQDLPFGLVLWSELKVGTPKVWTVAGELDLFNLRSL
jgi:hypothetical protein